LSKANLAYSVVRDRIGCYMEDVFSTRSLLVFLLFFFSLLKPGSCQISEGLYAIIPDSLKPVNRLQATLDEQGKILFYNSFFEGDSFLHELDEIAIKYTAEIPGMKPARKKLSAYDVICTYYLNKGSFDSALHYCNLYIYQNSLFLKEGPQFVRNLMMYKGIKGYLLSFKMQYEESITLLNESEAYYESANDSTGITDANMYLANIYLQLEMYEEALKCQKKALSYLKKNFAWNFSQLQIRSDMALTSLYLYDSEGDTAYGILAGTLLHELLKARDNDGMQLRSFTHALLSWKSLLDKDYPTTIAYSDSALSGADYFLSNKHLKILIAKLSKGYAAMQTGQPLAGIQILKSAVQAYDPLNDGIKSNLLYGDALLTIYQFEKTQGNWQEALYYFEKLKARSDSASLLHNRGVVLSINQRFNVAAKENQIKILASENHRQKNNLFYGIFAGLLLIIMLLLLLRNRQRMLEAEKRQAEQTVERERILRQKELVKLESKMLHQQNNAIMAQRKQISEDMHDDLSSALAGLKFYICDVRSGAVNAESKELLENIGLEVDAIYKNARQYIHNLNNSARQSQYNLAGYLHELNNNVFDKNTFLIEVSYSTTDIQERLNEEQQQHLYHIIKESVTNTIKHSKATKVRVELFIEHDHCTLIVLDNGIGFKPSLPETAQGMGLQSMNSRARDLGGTFDITSGTNGTSITVTFPL
jgi:signal transduction histidine kinase